MRDPEAAGAEWLAQWREDLTDYISREIIEGLVVAGRKELPHVKGTNYETFTDPSGGSSDSFTGAVAHREKSGLIVVDATREIPAPFDPAVATAEMAEFFKQYRVSRTTGDKYSAQWVVDEFGRNGVTYQQSDRSKSEIYREALNALNAKRVVLLDSKRLVNQICSLQRKVIRGTGRETIDHPTIAGARDDLANAALGAVVLCEAPLSLGEQLVAHPEVLDNIRRHYAGPRAMTSRRDPTVFF